MFRSSRVRVCLYSSTFSSNSHGFTGNCHRLGPRLTSGDSDRRDGSSWPGSSRRFCIRYGLFSGRVLRSFVW